MSLTLVLTALAVAGGLVGAVVAVWVGGRTRAGASSLVVAALVALALFGLAASVVVVVFALQAFAVAHLLYLLAVVAVPIVGLGVLVAWAWPRRRQGGALPALGVVLLLPGAVGVHATHIAPFQLRVVHAELAVDPARAPGEPLRLGIISDIQTPRIGGHERRAVERLLAADPDVILIAGDFFQGDGDELAATRADFTELLGRLEAPGGVFAVRGDVDHGSTLDRLVAGTDVQVLDDEVVTVRVGGTELTIGGTRLDWQSDAARAVYERLEAAPADQLAILLSHRPDAVLSLRADSRIDLTVAGHTHGGQIALPILGPPVTLSAVPRKVGAGGLHEVDGRPIYVSTGIGLERGQAPQVRFLTQPTIGIVTIEGPNGG